MRRPHPSAMTDDQLDRLASVSFVPDELEAIAVCYRRGGLTWAVFRSGTVWVRAPLPPSHELAEDGEG